jgi:hypothetical protein
MSCYDRGNPEEEFRIPQSIASTEEDTTRDDVTSASHRYFPTWINIEEKDMPYQYANMFHSSFGASILDTPNSILFSSYSSGRIVLMEYNKNTGIVGPFCKLATCLHSSDDCPMGFALMGMDYRDGQLSMLRGKEANITRAWISELRNGRFEFIAGPVSGFIRGDDAYYAVTPDSSLARIVYGSSDIEIVVDEFKYIKPVIINDYLYAVGTSGIIRVNLKNDDYEVEKIVNGIIGWTYSTDGIHLYYTVLSNGNLALYRCDMDGNNSELVLKMLVYPTYMSFDETYIYFSTFNRDDETDPTNGDIYRIKRDLTSEIELLVKTNARFPYVYTLPTSPDTLIVQAAIEGSTGNIYFLPKSGGELISIREY